MDVCICRCVHAICCIFREVSNEVSTMAEQSTDGLAAILTRTQVQEISVYEKSVNWSASPTFSFRQGLHGPRTPACQEPPCVFLSSLCPWEFSDSKGNIGLLDSQRSGAEWLFPTSFLLPHYSNEQLSPSAEGPKVHPTYPAQKVTRRVEERSRWRRG